MARQWTTLTILIGVRITPPKNPQAPAAAPNTSLSDADEAQPNPQTHKQASPRRKPRKHKPRNHTTTPTIEELFGINSDTWTRFFAITVAGDLDNVEIYDELNDTLKDHFDCYRRRDGAIIVDAKTQRNAEAIENLKTICL